MPWRNELQKRQSDRRAQSLWREPKQISSPPDRIIQLQGKPYLNFCSNNYLSFASDPRLATAASEAAAVWGTSTSASHLIVGHNDLHAQLETEIATFIGAQKAILFSTGYMANLAVPAALLDRQCLLVQDKLNHASLIDAARISDAKLRRYRHRDVAQARQLIAAEDSADFRRKLLATDGIFSMDGDIAPLADLQSICRDHQSVLLVDDAHGFGVLGDDGAGSLRSINLRPTGNVLLVGTLSKACGSFGAFVAGDAVYIDELTQHARSYIYTTALPSPLIAASRKSIELIQSEPWRREKLRENISQFRKLATQRNIRLADSVTPIQPIMIGDANETLQISNQLHRDGILCVAIRPPTVPVNQSRLRITLMTDHSFQDIERLIDSLHNALANNPPHDTR